MIWFTQLWMLTTVSLLLTARHLEYLQKPLVSSKNLVEKLEVIELDDGEVLTSFEVSALFTSMPEKEVVQMAINRAREHLTWFTRTQMTPDQEFGDILQNDEY